MNNIHNHKDYFFHRMRTFKEQLDHILDGMKHRCAIRDDKYWDLERMLPNDVVKNPNTLSMGWGGKQHEYASFYSDNRIHLELSDGYEVQILYICEGHGGDPPGPWIPTHFNGYVKIPSSAPFLVDVVKDGYDGFWNQVGVFSTSISFFHDAVLGWNHGSGEDADLSLSLEDQPDVSRLFGPVQIMKEAMAIIEQLRQYETSRQQEVKAQQFLVLEEELMRRTWHPKRVERWVEAGVLF